MIYQQNFCFLFPDFKLCWPRGLSPRGKNAFTWKHNGDTLIGIKTATWPLLFFVPLNQQENKEGKVLTVVNDLEYKEQLDYYSTVEVKKSQYELKKPCGMSPSIGTLCNYGHRRTTTQKGLLMEQTFQK